MPWPTGISRHVCALRICRIWGWSFSNLDFHCLPRSIHIIHADVKLVVCLSIKYQCVWIVSSRRGSVSSPVIILFQMVTVHLVDTIIKIGAGHQNGGLCFLYVSFVLLLEYFFERKEWTSIKIQEHKKDTKNGKGNNKVTNFIWSTFQTPLLHNHSFHIAHVAALYCWEWQAIVRRPPAIPEFFFHKNQCISGEYYEMIIFSDCLFWGVFRFFSCFAVSLFRRFADYN